MQTSGMNKYTPKSWYCTKCQCRENKVVYYKKWNDVFPKTEKTIQHPERLEITCTKCGYREDMHPCDTLQ